MLWPLTGEGWGESWWQREPTLPTIPAKALKFLPPFLLPFYQDTQFPMPQKRTFSIQTLPNTRIQIGRAEGLLTNRCQTQTVSPRSTEAESPGWRNPDWVKLLIHWLSDSKQLFPWSHRVRVLVNLELRLSTSLQELSSGHNSQCHNLQRTGAQGTPVGPLSYKRFSSMVRGKNMSFGVRHPTVKDHWQVSASFTVK